MVADAATVPSFNLAQAKPYMDVDSYHSNTKRETLILNTEPYSTVSLPCHCISIKENTNFFIRERLKAAIE